MKLGPREWLGVAIGGAFLVRVVPAWPHVFGAGRPLMQGVDAWYRLRLAENLAANFPRRLPVDPYLLMPDPGKELPGPALDYLVAALALPFGGAEAVAWIAALLPPVVGASLVVVVWALACRLGGRDCGLWAAFLVALMPGELMLRSRLGFGDHHAMESLLVALVMLASLRLLEARTSRQVVGRGVVAGFLLAFYLLTWIGGALLVFVIVAWLASELVVRSARGETVDPPVRAAALALPLAVVAILPWRQAYYLWSFQMAALVCGAGALFALWGLLKTTGPGVGKAALAVAVAGLLGVPMLRFGFPEVWASLAEELARLNPSPTALTVAEITPLISGGSAISASRLLHQFGLIAPFAVVGLALLGTRSFRREASTRRAVVVWSLVMMAATLGQMRFAYYSGVNVAILGGWLAAAWVTPSLSGRTWLRPARRSGRRIVAVLVLVVPVGLLGPLAASTDGTPPDTWLAATAWLRSSTPPPFEDLHYLSPVPQSRLPWRPPPEAYGVMSWWDYGYWLIGLAHRVPNANPTQAGARTAAAFFTETDPGRAAEILRQQRSRYVVVDGAMALRQNPGAEWLEGGFSAMLRWAGRDPDPYFERVYERDSQGRLVPLNVYFPAYYRSMLGRMLALDLPDEPPPAAVVVTLLQRRDDRGRTFHEVVRQRRFPTASEARRYLEVVGGPADRLVGLHPYRSPVVAELPEWLRPLHEILPEDPSGSPVRIFEARP